MTAVSVRPMRWPDIKGVHLLESELFTVDPWTIEQFWSELAQPTRRYVVAVDGERVVGYAGAFLLAPDSDVQTIAVSSLDQGRGIGATLLRSLMDEASAAGCRQMLLEVRSDNPTAIAMYKRFGFERISLRRDYYEHGIDAVIMRLRPIERCASTGSASAGNTT
jgi:ribosomal-protein-alanine N-acetyltransferase